MDYDRHMDEPVIFYSWQSDLPNAGNRSFIEKALEIAARAVADELTVQPVIDRDTQGMPGAPDISRAIFDKIRSAAVFVADVSLITPTDSRRHSPNPNVLLELGYALHALGEERVILVFNMASGRLEDLPFDLRTRRVLPYQAPAESTERAPERKMLASKLKDALTSALGSKLAVRVVLPADWEAQEERFRRLGKPVSGLWRLPASSHHVRWSVYPETGTGAGPADVEAFIGEARRAGQLFVRSRILSPDQSAAIDPEDLWLNVIYVMTDPGSRVELWGQDHEGPHEGGAAKDLADMSVRACRFLATGIKPAQPSRFLP
jgi:hypothetical protein